MNGGRALITAVCATIAAALLIAPIGALAQPPRPAKPPPRATSAAPAGSAAPARSSSPVQFIDSPAEIAAKRKAAGEKAMEAKEYDTAYEAFAEAYSNQQSFDLAGELGHAELELKRYRDAAEHLAWSLAHAPPDELAKLESTRKRLAEAKTHVASVQLNSSVPGAELRADGAKVGAAPLSKDKEELYYEPGPHVFEGRHPDYEPSRKDYTLAAGSATAIDLVLTPRRGGKPPVDGRVEPGGTSNSTPTVLMGVGFGLGGAALVASIASGIVSAKAGSDADSLRGQLPGGNCSGAQPPAGCSDLASDVSRQMTVRSVAIGMGVAAAGLFAVGIVGAVKRRPPPQAHVAPLIGPSTVGLLWRADF